MTGSRSANVRSLSEQKSPKWPAGFRASTAALGVAVLAAIAAGIVFRRSWSFGDVPTWVLAAATMMALVGAVVATRIAYNLYVLESERDIKAAEDRLLASEDRRRAAEDRLRADEERAARHLADQRTQAIAEPWSAAGPGVTTQPIAPAQPAPSATAGQTRSGGNSHRSFSTRD